MVSSLKQVEPELRTRSLEIGMMNQKEAPVRLKGVGDSLWVTIDPSQPVDFLLNKIDFIFKRLNHLAINARIVIDTGQDDEAVNGDLIENIGNYLKSNYNVGVVSGPPKKRSTEEERVRQQDIVHSWHHHRSDVLMLTGRVRSGQKVSARKHLLILGDVNPAGEVVAGGDIIVMGSLCGKAAAGYPDNTDAIVIALDLRPTQLQIGGFVAAGLPDTISQTIEFAHLENGVIVVEDYLKANPFKRLPWPEVR